MAKKSLEERIQRLEDVHEIQNLVNRYEYMLTGGLYEEVVEMFAQKTPGVTAELGPWGVYEGTAGIKKLYGPGGLHEQLQGKRGSLKPGVLYEQANTTPVIEVAGDGKTAKGVWICTGFATISRVAGKPQAYWQWNKRAYDFVKEDGEWKFWHYHVYGIFYCPYDKSWVEATEPPPPALPDELKADKPTTYHWIYSPTRAVEYIPAPPMPYETFDEKTSY